MNEWALKISLIEKHGFRQYEKAVTLPVTTFGERLASEMKLGIAFAGPAAFDETVKVLKELKFRRDLLIEAAKQIATQLADYLEDREGWHGEGRQEQILASERPTSPPQDSMNKTRQSAPE